MNAHAAGPFYFLSWSRPHSILDRCEGFYEIGKKHSTSREQIIRHIAGWQWDDLDKVYVASNGTFRDATREIAQAVLDLICREYSAPCHELRGWLETNLGINKVGNAIAEYIGEEA